VNGILSFCYSKTFLSGFGIQRQTANYWLLKWLLVECCVTKHYDLLDMPTWWLQYFVKFLLLYFYVHWQCGLLWNIFDLFCNRNIQGGPRKSSCGDCSILLNFWHWQCGLVWNIFDLFCNRNIQGGPRKSSPPSVLHVSLLLY